MALPTNYEVPTKDSSYFKPQDGDNKVRLLTDFLVGWVYWTNERKPVRLKVKPDTIPADMDTTGNIKEMWVALVWDYATEKVAIWEITQATIMRSIYEYEKDDEYGDSKGYDIKVNRAGKELETKYDVRAGIPKEVDANITDAVENGKLTAASLEEMFTQVDEDTTEASESTPF